MEAAKKILEVCKEERYIKKYYKIEMKKFVKQ